MIDYDDKEFEERLANFVNDVRNSIIENNKAITHAIDNWNRAKYDPVASIRSGDKLAQLLSKFLKEL